MKKIYIYLNKIFKNCTP